MIVPDDLSPETVAHLADKLRDTDAAVVTSYATVIGWIDTDGRSRWSFSAGGDAPMSQTIGLLHMAAQRGCVVAALDDEGD